MNVVFDFGAVLFTWQPAALLSEHFPELAATPDQAGDMARAIFSHDDWQSFDRGTLEIDTVIDRTATRLALPRDSLQALMAPIGERLQPIAANVALLGRLRERRERHGDVRLYFLSNMPEPFARTLEQRHDFLQWFDGGIFSGDVKLAKPDPAIFRLLASRYQLEQARTLFIDDALVNVNAAAALGWQTIHCQQPELLVSQFSGKTRL